MDNTFSSTDTLDSSIEADLLAKAGRSSRVDNRLSTPSISFSYSRPLPPNMKDIEARANCNEDATEKYCNKLIIPKKTDVQQDMRMLYPMFTNPRTMVETTIVACRDLEAVFEYPVMSPPARASRAKFHWGIAFATGLKRYTDPVTKLRMKHTNRRVRIPKDGTISKFPEYHSSEEEEEPTEQPRPLNKYGFVDHLELQRNEFAPHRLPQREGNMNGWLIEDEDEPLGYEASDKEVDSDLESIASSKPKCKKLKKTAKAIPDRMFCNCPYFVFFSFDVWSHV
ncbi:hypothetical protein Tco_0904412 [Tanacetum coccineum]